MKHNLSVAAMIAAMALGEAGKGIAFGYEKRDGDDAPGLVETRKAIDALQGAWKEYRDTNDARLTALEKKGSVDVIDAEKLSRLDGALTELQKRCDELELKSKRPGAPAADEVPGADPEYRTAFHQFLRRGEQALQAPQHAMLQKRAMSAGDNTEGGYLTNPELDREVAKLARNMSSARQLFGIRSVGASVFTKPMSKSNASTGWVGETDGRPQTNPSDLIAVSIPTHEIYANVYATQTILDDAFINLEQFIAEEAVEAFDDGEGDAFFTGNGVNKPRGLLSLDVTVETGSTRAAQGKLGVVKSGSAANFGTGLDTFIDVIARLRPRYRQGARWLWNTLTEAPIRKIKDANDNYMWQPSNAVGVPATFLGYAVSVADHMPDIGDGNIPVAFGDFKRGYLIVDRVGMRTLRDPFSVKPYVLFYMTKRVGGAPLITEAYKGLQTAA